MLSGIPIPTGSKAQRTILYANSDVTGVGWQTYNIPPNASMLYILLLAGGGAGAFGLTVAPGGGGGGGGGGSSGQTVIIVSAAMLPPTLFFSIGYGGRPGISAAGSRVSIHPDTTANHCLAIANPGSNGGSPAAGSGGSVALPSAMPLHRVIGQSRLLAGQAGTAGVAANGTPINVPTNGLVVTGGTAGGSMPAAGSPGWGSGNISLSPSDESFFPTQLGGAGGSSATTPPENGSNGINFINDLAFFYGGTGGGSTHGSATGSGLIKSAGGNGGYGCGGGGGGAGITGSTGGNAGIGGNGIAIIYAW